MDGPLAGGRERDGPGLAATRARGGLLAHIAAGADWFGAMRSSGARLVGIASYSVHLINFIVASNSILR